MLKRVDATRPAGFVRKAFAAIATTSVARFLSRHVYWTLDRFLLRVTGGRIRSTLMVPSALLGTVGARTGEPRRNAVIYFHDGDRVTIVASYAGDPRNPSWFFNLRANPDVTLNGDPFHATVVEDEAERARLWALADNVFPAFATYRRDAAKAGRTIPIVQLSPVRS